MTHLEIIETSIIDGDMSDIIKLINNPYENVQIYDYSKGLQLAAEWGEEQAVKLLIPVSNPLLDSSKSLRFAAEHGYAKCVELLIPVSEPKAIESRALQLALENGHGSCAKLLIPVSDLETIKHNLIERLNFKPLLLIAAILSDEQAIKELIENPSFEPSDYKQPLNISIDNGNMECVKLLASANNKEGVSEALSYAAQTGKIESVKFLIPHSNPETNTFLALRKAVENRHTECIKLLLPVSDLATVQKQLVKIRKFDDLAFLESFIQKENLTTKNPFNKLSDNHRSL